MTDNAPDRGKDAFEPHPTTGLRLRLWLACLGGSLVAAGGIWWVIGTQTGPGAATDLTLVVSWLGVVAGLAVVVGAAFALWLDRGIVVQTRGLVQAAATQQIAPLRGLPATSGWGELSQLTQLTQRLVTRYRSAERAADEMGLLRDQLRVVGESLERWTEMERWVEVRFESGPAAPVVEALNQGLRRLDEVREQNLEAARQIAGEMGRALETARDSAEQAERGFVEATALLTTVRELQRLAQDLGQAVSATTSPGAGAAESAGAAARQAIEELVAGSTQSVEHLVRGLRKVEEIADQVPRLANRATLIALNQTLGGRVVPESERAEETRQLVLDIRSAVDRTSHLSRELEGELASAAAEMRAVRERVATRLEGAVAAAGAAPPTGDATRLLDRVREMVQDATRKGERLSATGEGTSRSADGLLRLLEAETREMAGLLARLAPVEHAAVAPPAAEQARALKLLEPDRPADRTEPRRAPGAGEEPR
jgi:hypothetical protein